ncbi:hypothetical protein GOODEAATRI_029213, partial [Goodea atripinnis]
ELVINGTIQDIVYLVYEWSSSPQSQRFDVPSLRPQCPSGQFQVLHSVTIKACAKLWELGLSAKCSMGREHSMLKIGLKNSKICTAVVQFFNTAIPGSSRSLANCAACLRPLSTPAFCLLTFKNK